MLIIQGCAQNEQQNIFNNLRAIYEHLNEQSVKLYQSIQILVDLIMINKRQFKKSYQQKVDFEKNINYEELMKEYQIKQLIINLGFEISQQDLIKPPEVLQAKKMEINKINYNNLNSPVISSKRMTKLQQDSVNSVFKE